MKVFRSFILALCGKKEGYEVEFKGAKGGFPGSFWESYSAFANTAAGIIVLEGEQMAGTGTQRAFRPQYRPGRIDLTLRCYFRTKRKK